MLLVAVLWSHHENRLAGGPGPEGPARDEPEIRGHAGPLERGKYITEAQAAVSIATRAQADRPRHPMVEGKRIGPGPADSELGDVIAPNISPDPETGIGNWTDDEIARAIQEGVDKDGRALFRSCPTCDSATPTRISRPSSYCDRSRPSRTRCADQAQLPAQLHRQDDSRAADDTRLSPRGHARSARRVLVETIIGCGDCHTPTNQGNPLPGMSFGGGESFDDPSQQRTIFSANITMDASGIAHYDEALFINTLRTGQIPGRKLSHIMPFEAFMNMTDDDLKDVFAYIKTRPPVKHRVSNVDPPTLCVLCNKTHGLGELNKKAGQ
jgi:hypothetical protein